MHKVHNGTVFIKGIYTSGNSREAELVRPKIQKRISDTCIHEMILCMESTQRYCIYQRNLYFSELTHGRTGLPEDIKENSGHVRTWVDIMHVNCANLLYLSKESIFQWTHAWPDRFARTSKREYQIHAYMRWYYACEVRKGIVFIKGIYASGNSRMAELVRSNIQKKIADTCIVEMILCMESTQRYCESIFIKGIYISVNSRMAGLVRPNIQKRIADMCVHEMILCV